MRKINMQTWPRRKHFQLFKNFDQPHFGLAADVEITNFYQFVKDQKLSFNIAAIYILTRAANAIPEFRYRIRGEDVIEHEVVHPSSTILLEDDTFTFCTIQFAIEFAMFSERAKQAIEHVKMEPSLADGPGEDDLIFMTAIPWVSFTAFKHPMHLSPPDSIPRIAWGKYFSSGEHTYLPVGVQGHHALMDGLHAGRFYAELEDIVERPDEILV